MIRISSLRNKILLQKPIPTTEQGKAIFTEELEFLLRASPGSGKTWTSSRRFIWRAANWPYSAGGLALFSFTNSAIREFQQETIRIGCSELLSEPNYVGTFDAFIERFILTPFGHLIAGSSRRPRLFVAPRHGDRNNSKLKTWIETKSGQGRWIRAWEIIPYLKDKKTAFRTLKGVDFRSKSEAARQAVAELMSMGYYTHEHRVYWAVRLLKDRPHLAKLLAKRFPEIIVDEAQDTNVWLIVLLNLIRVQGSKVTLVGDQYQCIYEFAMAESESLSNLKAEWSIPEKLLSKSFRCNDPITKAIRNIGGNPDFYGRGPSKNTHCQPWIVKEADPRFANSIEKFRLILNQAGIPVTSSAILCRAHEQLEVLYGDTTYTKFQGTTKELAKAAFYRDCRRDYKKAYDYVVIAIRKIFEDDNLWERIDEEPESFEAQDVKLIVWRFVRSPISLPMLNLIGNEWIQQLRQSIMKMGEKLPVSEIPKLGRKIRITGLDDAHKELPLLSTDPFSPTTRRETIHGVKGASIDGVLVLGASGFWNKVVSSIRKGKTTEDRRLAYVAMSRAREILVVSLPDAHFDKHEKTWTDWGFRVL